MLISRCIGRIRSNSHIIDTVMFQGKELKSVAGIESLSITDLNISNNKIVGLAEISGAPGIRK